MEQDYDFFDREIYDPIWALSWHDFTRRYRTRWALRHSYTSGEYSGGSLRELIAFTFDPEPSKDEIDDIIDQRTIRWTLRRSKPQLFTMSCIMWSGLPRLHGKFHLSTCSEIGGFLAVATDAYLENRIGARTLRAALNLHSVEDVESYLTLTRQERSDLKSAFLFDELNRTLYSWQGDTNLAGEEDASCLGVADTRRFIDFVVQAWNGNWPAPRLRDQVTKADNQSLRFRDFEFTQELARPLLQKKNMLKSPSVFRRWN